MTLPLLAVLSTLLGAESALAELERLDRALVQSELRLQELTSERDGLTVEIATLTAEQTTAQVRADEAFTDYTRRLRALARMPTGARVMLLGDTTSLADYLDLNRVLRWITTHDRRLHQRHTSESQRVETLRQSVTTRAQRLAQALEAARMERDRLGERRHERVTLLAALLADSERARRTHEEQQVARSAVGTMLRRLNPDGRLHETFAKNRGKLPWPTVGAIRAGFGDVVDRRLGTTVSHTGIDFAAQTGASVQAVASGVIAYVGWLKGYGQIVIIDHGDEYHTLYAHLASTAVAVGDLVVDGAIVGRVGDTGSLSGARLYFELRHHGITQNPRPWLRQ